MVVMGGWLMYGVSMVYSGRCGVPAVMMVSVGRDDDGSVVAMLGDDVVAIKESPLKVVMERRLLDGVGDDVFGGYDDGEVVVLVLVTVKRMLIEIMPPRMRTRSAGRPAAESLGGGMGERVSRGGKGKRPREGNDERVDELNGQG
ncbi:hypothetical protein Tco_1102001 [Tanacetum coccineum]